MASTLSVGPSVSSFISDSSVLLGRSTFSSFKTRNIAKWVSPVMGKTKSSQLCKHGQHLNVVN